VAEAIPGHWAAGIRKNVINKYKNSMDTFLEMMKEKGVAGEYLVSSTVVPSDDGIDV
jgi:hypothetical protein